MGGAQGHCEAGSGSRGRKTAEVSLACGNGAAVSLPAAGGREEHPAWRRDGCMKNKLWVGASRLGGGGHGWAVSGRQLTAEEQERDDLRRRAAIANVRGPWVGHTGGAGTCLNIS